MDRRCVASSSSGHEPNRSHHRHTAGNQIKYTLSTHPTTHTVFPPYQPTLLHSLHTLSTHSLTSSTHPIHLPSGTLYTPYQPTLSHSLHTLSTYPLAPSHPTLSPYPRCPPWSPIDEAFPRPMPQKRRRPTVFSNQDKVV